MTHHAHTRRTKHADPFPHAQTFSVTQTLTQTLYLHQHTRPHFHDFTHKHTRSQPNPQPHAHKRIHTGTHKHIRTNIHNHTQTRAHAFPGYFPKWHKSTCPTLKMCHKSRKVWTNVLGHHDRKFAVRNRRAGNYRTPQL